MKLRQILNEMSDNVKHNFNSSNILKVAKKYFGKKYIPTGEVRLLSRDVRKGVTQYKCIVRFKYYSKSRPEREMVVDEGLDWDGVQSNWTKSQFYASQFGTIKNDGSWTPVPGKTFKDKW